MFLHCFPNIIKVLNVKTKLKRQKKPAQPYCTQLVTTLISETSNSEDCCLKVEIIPGNIPFKFQAKAKLYIIVGF